jgi:hypothetical protein
MPVLGNNITLRNVTAVSNRVPSTPLTVAGTNDDVENKTGFLRITSTVTNTAVSFSISGFAAKADGHVLRVYNPSMQPMVLQNDVSSVAANRILTMTGADVTLTGPGFATFVYSADDERWVLTSTQA